MHASFQAEEYHGFLIYPLWEQLTILEYWKQVFPLPAMYV